MADSPPHKRQRRDSSSAASAASEEEQAQDVFKISPDGDVIFAFEDGTKQIQVHSFILKNASLVFSAMLGGNFKEGQMLEQAAQDNQPIEIPLPDDDYYAFSLICLALHNQSCTMENAPDVDDLIQIFKVADKYNLVDSISLSFQAWVMNYDNKETSSGGLWSLMLICHEMKADKPFQALSKRIILQHGGSFLGLAYDGLDGMRHLGFDSISYKLAASLEEMRRHLIQSITQTINSDMYRSFHKGQCDEEIYRRVLFYYRHLGEVFMQTGDNDKRCLYKVGQGFSVYGLIKQIEQFKGVPDRGNHNLSRNTPSGAERWYGDLIIRLRRMEIGFRGCCISCISQNNIKLSCSGHDVKKS